MPETGGTGSSRPSPRRHWVKGIVATAVASGVLVKHPLPMPEFLKGITDLVGNSKVASAVGALPSWSIVGVAALVLVLKIPGFFLEWVIQLIRLCRGVAVEWVEFLKELRGVGWNRRGERWAARWQRVARKANPCYPVMMKIMPPLLGMGAAEMERRLVAEGCVISVEAVQEMIDQPSRVAKEEYLPALCKVLMIPANGFVKNRLFDYTKQQCGGRLTRYHNQGRALVHTYAGPGKAPDDLGDFEARKLKRLVKLVEQDLLEQSEGGRIKSCV